MKINVLLIFFAITCLASFCMAQAPSRQLSLQHIKSGLSQSSATQIFEDSYGFLWIGTPNGLNKYDGTNFQIFERSLDGEIGLTDGYVEKIYEDSQRQLYIGTNQGLNYYNRSLNQIAPYPFRPEAQFLQAKYFGAVTRTHDYLWLGTDNSGVYRYEINTGETKQIIFDEIQKGGPSNHYIVEVFPVGDDKLLIITQASIYLINHNLQVLRQIESPQNLSCAIESDGNTFLLGSHDGELIELSIQRDYSFRTKKTSISQGYSILSLTVDMQNDVWLGTENDGLFIYTPSTGSISHYKQDVAQPNHISSNSIWSMLTAQNGVVWMGPFKNGLSFFDQAYRKFTHIEKDPFSQNSLSNNIVNCFHEDEKGNLWIGTDGGGLNYWDRSENSFQEYSLANGKLHSDVVLSVSKDKWGKLWIGSWAKGLSIFDPVTEEFEVWTKENSFLGSNNVIDIHQDRKGRFWIVTLFGGVHVYYPETGDYQHVSIRSEKDGSEAATVARLLEDHNGTIWIGTQTLGLFRLVENNNRWIPVHYHSIHEKRKISNDFINTMVQDDEGNMWVGTQAGLNKYLSGSDSFLIVNKASGLMDDAIRSIVEDKDGSLWLGTGKGLIRYNPNSDSSVNYNIDDGLQGNEFNASSSYHTAKNELLFGGSNGFNIFRPEDVSKRKDQPKLYISGLKIFNRPVLPNDGFGVLNHDISQVDSITLDYSHNVVNFEFHTLTYRHPERVNYAYFLEEFENEWNYVGQDRHATYTNLSPGNYVLRIKSTNSDGVWNDEEVKLHVSVKPPYWQTWWFRTALISMVVVLVFFAHKLRVKNLEHYQTRLESDIDERTRELQQKQEKLIEVADELSIKNEEIQRFAFAVSHDLKSPLNSIKGIASLIPMEVDIEQNEDLKEYVRYIDETCDTMNNLITDITKIAKLGKIENNLELLDTKEILDLAGNLVVGRLKEKNANLIIDKHLPSIYGDRNRIIQVFENLLDNAIKYMGEQKVPVIKIEAAKDNNKITFKVIDNGSGMNQKDLNKLFTPFERFDGSVEGTGLGLYMVKKIIESHGGNISAFSDGKGKGTTFKVTLPCDRTQRNAISDEHGMKSHA